MLSTIFISAMMMLNAPADNTAVTTNEFVVESAAQGVVFRSTQRLRSDDGWSIYLSSSGRCEIFNGDYPILKCRYTLQYGEIRLLDEDGDLLYRCSYTKKSDGQNLSTVTFNGIVFKAF